MSADLTRRSVLNGCALCAVAGVVGFAVAKNSDAAEPRDPGEQANAYGATKTTADQPLATLSQIPSGGGLILTSKKIVLTKDSSGTVHGFSAICTHQGCPVGSVEGGVIVCPCHGSKFNLTTGAPVAGPATSPLPTVAVVVRGDSVYAS